MSLLHFGAMYALMYAMVDAWPQVVANYNQAYMAALMTAPMLIFELLLMRGMYPRRGWNVAILAGGAILLVGAFALIRTQAAIDDEQFLRSMIPHHSGAILMCRESRIADPRIVQLCDEIVESQRREIRQMEELLDST